MEPGQQISANLRLVRLLGQGGMGSVWVADHLTLGTQVAVKLMARAVAAEPHFVERFRREAAAAAQLKSPHVAQVFDHGIAATGEPFIVMELLEGEDVGKRIERTGQQAPAFVAEVILQVAKALSRAHAAGMVHRDIKAENLFLVDHDGDLLVKVLDFGIAKTQGDAGVSVTSTQGTFGTPLYMGPEQLLSAKHVDHRADLWSLAVVAYYMLTRRFPYEGETLGAISVAVHAGRFKPPSELSPALSPEVDAWFARAFERDVARRFGSAKELAETLRAALARCATVSQPFAAVSSRFSDPEGIGHLPTMDSGAVSQGVSGSLGSAAGGSATLSGTETPGNPEPRKRTVLLAVVGLSVGAIAAFVWLGVSRSSSSGDAGRETGLVTSAAPPLAASAQSTVTAEVSASLTTSTTAAPDASASASAPAVAASGAPHSPSAKPSASASAKAGPVPPASTKKDDIGF